MTKDTIDELDDKFERKLRCFLVTFFSNDSGEVSFEERLRLFSFDTYPKLSLSSDLGKEIFLNKKDFYKIKKRLLSSIDEIEEMIRVIRNDREETTND